MRSPSELLYRARQEASNLLLLAAPPHLEVDVPIELPLLPSAATVAGALGGTSFAAEVEILAGDLLEHRFPLLSLTVNAGPRIAWRRDVVHGRETDTRYFRRVPYLDFARAGDHKIIWELNRHQHLVALAQAFTLTGRSEFAKEIFRQMESWMAANPFLRGINWASALEVAFRALSWIWVWHLTAGCMPPTCRARVALELYRHGCYLERNLSVYFSPNTHLLGEAVALHALGVLFPAFPGARRWAETGARVVREQLARQVRPDGSHFEQSAYYHVYALDFFLFHAVLARPGGEYTARLETMAGYLRALMGPARALPLVGDDDGGRLFHPYGERVWFGRATLATCAALLGRSEWPGEPEDLHVQAVWWLGDGVLRHKVPLSAPPFSSRLFADAGVAVMADGPNHVVVKAGPFGEGSGGHSHSDVLSLVARRGPREILIDSGTFTYVADMGERNAFRGTAAHNAVRIAGRDQAVPAGPFRWTEKPQTAIHEWAPGSCDVLEAECSYGGFTHRRRVLFLKPDVVATLDEILGPAGEWDVEQFWHLATPEDAVRLAFNAAAETLAGWRSRVFGAKEAATVLRVPYRGTLPVRMAAVLDLGEAPEPAVIHVREEDEAILLGWHDRQIRFPRHTTIGRTSPP